MELYFGTQYVKVTAKGLNESAENAADDSSILTQKMKDLLNVDPEILAHVMDSSTSLDTSVMDIINNNNVTDSPKDDAEEASETGDEKGGETDETGSENGSENGGKEGGETGGQEGEDVYNETIYDYDAPNSEARNSLSQDSQNLFDRLRNVKFPE